MLPKRTIAALAAGAALMWGSAHAAPETPEGLQGAPVIILELQPGTTGSEQEQAVMAMLLLQLLMGLQAETESVDTPTAAPKAGEQRI